MKTGIALSGGVDSAVAAYKLKEQGHDLVGVFMRFWHEPEIACSGCVENKCCSADSLLKIKKICLQLDIPLLIFNFENEFKKQVVDKFIEYYESGKTPNPCVWCNQEIKFKLLLEEAIQHNIEKIATGHYAGIEAVDGHYYIRRGLDQTKDQSYFLYRIDQTTLKQIIFPLADTLKEDNAKLAEKVFPSLNFNQQKESQDLCFYPESSYKPFILRNSQKLADKGDIVDIHGKVIGEHDGLINYTLGQRRGISIGGGPILYVKEIDIANNRLVVADKSHILCDTIKIDQIISSPMLSSSTLSDDRSDRDRGSNSLSAQIRYGHDPAACSIVSFHPRLERGQPRSQIRTLSESLSIRFAEPQFAPTPGQHCVIYQDNLVIGGGEIT